MKRAVIGVIVLASVIHASDVPFYLRTMESQRDISGINENFRSVVNDITKLRSDVDEIVVEQTAPSVSSATVILNAAGYVPNNQLDSSSVTKQGFVTLANLTGAVPQSSVNLSTVTTALAGVGVSTAALSVSTAALEVNKVDMAGDNMYGNLGMGTYAITTNNLKANAIVLTSTGGATAIMTQRVGFAGDIALSGGLANGGNNGTNRMQRLTESGDLLNIRRVQAKETVISNVPDFLISGTRTQINSGADFTYAKVIDVNQDGKQDMVYALNMQSMKVSIGAGNGFAAATPYSSANFGSSSGNGGLDVDDVNGDGLPDIVAVNSVDGLAVVWLNRGISTAATFATAFETAVTYNAGTANTDFYSMHLGDLNGDGKPDIAVNRALSDLLVILMNNGDGTFASPVTYATGDNPSELVIADFNRDGRNDIMIGNYNDNNVSVFLNTGSGVFGARTNFALGSVVGTDYGGNPSALAVIDINLDGKLDVLVANHGTVGAESTLTRLLGDGAGSFATPINYYSCQFTSDVKVGDFSGDGIDDALAVCDASRHTMNYYTGIGTGTFNTVALRDMTGGNQMNKMAIGDINNDGHLDVVFNADTGTPGTQQLVGVVNRMVYAQASNSRVGISTGSPQTTLDVEGSASFGSVPTKSTFSTAGSLTLASNADLTLTGPTAYATFPATVTASKIIVTQIGVGTSNPASGVHISSKILIIDGNEDIAAIMLGTLVIGATYQITPAALFQVQGGSFTVLSNGHVQSGGDSPALSSCGGGSPSIVGNDTSGKVTLGTITSSCTLTFKNPWTNAPACVATNETNDIVVRGISTVTTLTLSGSASIASDTVSYQCAGYR